MSTKFEAFQAALVRLLEEYDYKIESSLYDTPAIFDRKPGESVLPWAHLMDRTEETPK